MANYEQKKGGREATPSYGDDKKESGAGRETYNTPFAKDKRPRTAQPKTTYKPAREYGESGGERKSYNPNFTKDNKLKDQGERKPYAPREGYEPRTGAKKEYGGGNQYGERKPYGEKKTYGENKPYGERKPYGDKPYGERKPYGDKKAYGENKPYGDRKPYGDKPYGDKKPYGNKPYGAKPGYGGKPGGGKPFGKPYGKPGRSVPKSYQSGEAPEGDYPQFPAPQFDNAIRLNRYIATSGLCSRREADQFILSGVVTVNGLVVTELGVKVQPTDVVRFNDSVVQSEKKIYILMNKPKGFVTSLEDDHADRTVMDIVRNACNERVYPVGRLDKNSLGVLLLTNDGDLTKQLTHPSYKKKKIYQVSLDKPLARADMEKIAEGIELEDGEIFADEVAYVKDNKKEIGIEIHSGRNRIVRRIFEHLGYKVQKLDRVYFAGLTKKNLKRGAWRFLTPKEVGMLKSGLYE